MWSKQQSSRMHTKPIFDFLHKVEFQYLIKLVAALHNLNFNIKNVIVLANKAPSYILLVHFGIGDVVKAVCAWKVSFINFLSIHQNLQSQNISWSFRLVIDSKAVSTLWCNFVYIHLKFNREPRCPPLHRLLVNAIRQLWVSSLLDAFIGSCTCWELITWS